MENQKCIGQWQWRLMGLAATFLSLGQGSALAQREVLQQESLQAYERRLPAVTAALPAGNLKAYLLGLKNRGANREVANAVRVAADTQDGGLGGEATFAYYRVPAMSPEMRLPDAYPADGEFQAPLTAILAGDEYEPASFVVFPFADLERISFKVTALKGPGGASLGEDQLDLKTVKVWYQNGNGWFSYFQDVGLQLVPELLLHDEKLVRVDTNKVANYARVKTAEGLRETWISAPRKLDAGFDPYQDGFADAATMQPVTLQAGQFKQFILTIHAKRETPPGLYKGGIEVSGAGMKPALIPVAVRVLPFDLPLPKANYDVNKDFLVTLMGAWPKVPPEQKGFLATLKDLRQHNILQLGPNAGPQTPKSVAELQVKLMKEAGFETNFIFGGNLPWVGAHDGTPLTFDELMRVKKSTLEWKQFYRGHFGETTAALGLGDEQGAAWVQKTRPAWRIVQQEGLKTMLAGHQRSDFAKGGFMLDVRPTAGTPAEAEKARQWAAIGKGHTGFYANQHNGSENPAFVRRQHGLLGYLADFDMVDNYEFAYGPWNDLATELYKPMVLAYPTSDGLVDTLAWEGFREGIDDIRYATKLRQLAKEAVDSKDIDREYEGRKVYQWMASLDGSTADLNTVRMEMIEKILTLLEMSGRAGKAQP